MRIASASVIRVAGLDFTVPAPEALAVAGFGASAAGRAAAFFTVLFSGFVWAFVMAFSVG
jgi:hypothetical protein